MKVFLSSLAAEKLIELNEYLLQEWNLKVRNEFLSKFNEKVHQIATHPESCPKSSVLKGLYKCVVTKQTTFYYRVNKLKKEIEIITLFDTRQHPDNLKNKLFPKS